MATHTMNPVDAAWYHLDGPANPAVVNALITTRRPMRFERVKAVIEQRLLRFDRFRQRVAEPALHLGTPSWEDVPELEIERHLHRVAVPAPHDEAALRTLVADLASAALPHGQPLWQVYVIDGVGEGGALMLRYHHCIGDGLAMMTVAEALFDTSTRPRLLPPPDADAASASAPALLISAFDAIAQPRQLLDAATRLSEGARTLIKDLLKRDDPASPFKGEFGPRQSVAWSRPVAVEDLKAIGWPFNAKVNDVLVAALAGALRGYLVERGMDAHHPNLRAMVPVSLRPPERAHALGNEFGLVILELPVGEHDALHRVMLAKARMDSLKRSPEAVAMQWLFEIFGRGPKPLEDLAQSLFGAKASVVLTNVAGPRRQLYLAGSMVDRMMFWVPHPGDELGMGLSFMSYRDQVQLGVIADARLVPDPERIAAAFDAEIEGLLAQHAHAAKRLGAMRRKRA